MFYDDLHCVALVFIWKVAPHGIQGIQREGVQLYQEFVPSRNEMSLVVFAETRGLHVYPFA
jgi:hypothetical protein